MEIRGKVSIIIPIYNTANYIEKCLNSVIQQTYSNIEIIIVNDGSNDGSEKICKHFASKHKNVKLINQNNSGPSMARNNGIKASTGKYIQFVDSDDIIESDMTEKLISSMEDDVQLVICGYRVLHLQSGVERITNNIPAHCGSKELKDFLRVFGIYYENSFINSPCNKMYLSDIIKENKISFNPKVRLGEDLLFNLNYLKECKKITIIKDVLYNYIAFNLGSLTRSYKKDLFQNQIMLLDNVKKFLIENDSYSFKNQIVIENMYFVILIASLQEIVIRKKNLKFNEKLNEIQFFTRDKAINYFIKSVNSNKLKFENKIVKSLFRLKSGLGIFVYFTLKEFAREKCKYIFIIIKRFMV